MMSTNYADTSSLFFFLLIRGAGGKHFLLPSPINPFALVNAFDGVVNGVRLNVRVRNRERVFDRLQRLGDG